MTDKQIVPNEDKVSGFIVYKNVKYIKIFRIELKEYMLIIGDNSIRIFRIEEINGKIECIATND